MIFLCFVGQALNKQIHRTGKSLNAQNLFDCVIIRTYRLFFLINVSSIAFDERHMQKAITKMNVKNAIVVMICSFVRVFTSTWCGSFCSVHWLSYKHFCFALRPLIRPPIWILVLTLCWFWLAFSYLFPNREVFELNVDSLALLPSVRVLLVLILKKTWLASAGIEICPIQSKADALHIDVDLNSTLIGPKLYKKTDNTRCSSILLSTSIVLLAQQCATQHNSKPKFFLHCQWRFVIMAAFACIFLFNVPWIKNRVHSMEFLMNVF